MKGTEKQIKWAEDIREAMVAKIKNHRDAVATEEVKPVRSLLRSSKKTDEQRMAEAIERHEFRLAQAERALAAVESFEDASWYIDNRAYAGDGWTIDKLLLTVLNHAEYVESKNN